MKSAIILFLIISSIQRPHSTKKTTEVTISVNQRIELLKREILGEIDGKSESDQFTDIYEYVDMENKPITPILDTDKRKLKGRFKLPEIKSTTTQKYVASDVSQEDRSLANKHRKPKSAKRMRKPKEIFYRKMFSADEDRHQQQKWTHCLDLVSPFLSGFISNKSSKYVVPKNPTVIRLSQLLSINTTHHSKDDIRSILYQISNLPVKLFQWDVMAIKLLINVIIRNGTYDFKGLKHGIKEIFATWQLDISDVNSFLSQTRIFRPPCIMVSEFDGSTVTAKNLRYTKPEKKKCKEESDDENCST